MELSFFIMMLCMSILVVAFIYLVHTHEHRKCDNCKFFRMKPGSKHYGTCNGFGHTHFKWETGCGEWKRKPIKYLEEE